MCHCICSLQKLVLSAINYQYKKDNDISKREQGKGLKNYIHITNTAIKRAFTSPKNTAH